MNGKILRVGLAIGGGTGPELAEIFERALRELAAREKMHAEIIRSPREYRTYGPMAALTSAEAVRATEEDAADYIRFVRELAADGIRVAFRTAFNAQSLYLVRDELLGVKVEPMRHSDGELLLIRDETQGFYSGRNDQPADPLRIRRETLFSRENTWCVLDFSIENAAARWGGASTSTELSSPANSICWRIVSRNGFATTSASEVFAFTSTSRIRRTGN